MKTIKQTYRINAPVLQVWKALVDPEYINAWGGGPAKMSAEPDFKFTLWKGEIFGKNLEVVNKKKLVQEWWSRDDKWDEPSIVTFNIAEKNGKTVLELVAENVPDKNADDIDSGWKDFYLAPLKKYLEKKH